MLPLLSVSVQHSMYSRANIIAEPVRKTLKYSRGRLGFSRPLQEQIFARPITHVCRTRLKNKALHPVLMISLSLAPIWQTLSSSNSWRDNMTAVIYSPMKGTGAESNAIISRISLLTRYSHCSIKDNQNVFPSPR